MASRALTVIFSCLLSTTIVTAATLKAADDQLIWGGCGITKKAFMSELAMAYEKKTGIKIVLQGGGATKGIRDVVKGDIHIGGACRSTIDSELKERLAHQIPVAWDALVVIVHKDNAISNITLEQLKAIYLGKIKNWQELGGRDRPVELYVRRGKISGVGRTLREIVFANFNQEFQSTHIEKSSGPLEQGVENNINGVGVTGISSAKRRNVKILKLEGHAPNYENIKSGNYTLYRPLYLVTKERNITDKRVKDFISFALSAEGKGIIRKAGTVPYSDAIALVMKQVEQYEDAEQRGLYR